jgi:nitrogen fixation-related uncharacterized protein
MRYGFNQESISYVNRVLDVIAGSGVNGTKHGGPITDKESEQQFNLAMGGNRTYGYNNFPLMSAMWTTADMNTDWGGDSEAIYDIDGEWSLVALAWESTLHWGAVSGQLHDNQKAAEDVIHDAVEIIAETENKIWLAMLVAGAILNLEGNTVNVFDSYPDVNEEFKSERVMAKTRAFALISTRREFDHLAR